MGWKATGAPSVRKQRDKWVVRVDGIDTETGRHRPRQLGTFNSQRAALTAARAASAEDAAAARDTVGWLVRRYVTARTDLSLKTTEQYSWAAGHIERGLGSLRLDQLDREDIARWLNDLARRGELGRRSIQVCRNVLKAALADAVDEGLLRRSPAARVALPREVAKPARVREVDAWSSRDVDRFLEITTGHRLAIGFRLGVLYGLRRSELLALRWDDVDEHASTIRVDEGLVPLDGGDVVWTDAKNARSRRLVPLDAESIAGLRHRCVAQAQERLIAGPEWEDHDLILTTVTGKPVQPRSFDRALEVVIRKGELPRLSSHGLRHTAATHMVQGAVDVGELRAVADVLGHSPEMLLTVYAHALPTSVRAVADRVARRSRTQRCTTGGV